MNKAQTAAQIWNEPVKTPIAKTGEPVNSEAEGAVPPLPEAEVAASAPSEDAVPPARALRLAPTEGEVTPAAVALPVPLPRRQPAFGQRAHGGPPGVVRPTDLPALPAAQSGAEEPRPAPPAAAKAAPAPQVVNAPRQAPQGGAPQKPGQPNGNPQRPNQQWAAQRAQAAQQAAAQPQTAQPQPAQQPKAPPKPAVPVVTVQAARLQMRHFALMLLFALMVVLPAGVYGTYLYTLAADRYESDVGFGSRTEEASNTFDVLGVLGGGNASTKDMDILNQFVYSQELVERVDRKLDLRKIWSRHPEDWLFSFPPDGPIEDLVDYWNKMVLVNYDASTGLMSLEVFAFRPEDAQAIAHEVVEESTAIINELSKTAQDDTTRYARETLAKAEERYRKAQNDLADFRIKKRIVDPQTELTGASQVINSLVQQMAEAQINLDMLKGQIADNDPRIGNLNRRIEVIQKRIAEETSKVGSLSDPADPGYAALIRDYQNLNMEMEFSQKSYMAAQGAYDQAVNDATQQTHYLATFLAPTVAESTTAPDRPLHIFLIALVGLLAWAALAMIYYALRDRR